MRGMLAPRFIPREYDETYRVTPAVAMASAWIVATLSVVCVVQERPRRDSAAIVVFAAATRLVRTYVGSCLVPFMTNVVRDHKCREWTDMPRSILVTIVYKLFYGMQDIVDVLLVVSFDWRVYATLIVCDVCASCLSTVQFLQAKERILRAEKGDAPAELV